jgi:hypothetical protein
VVEEAIRRAEALEQFVGIFAISQHEFLEFRMKDFTR